MGMPGRKEMVRWTKAALLKREPIRWETRELQERLTRNRETECLYTHEIPEISIVLSGSGNHRIMNQVIPCKTGDMFITRADVPHCFFASDGEMRIRQLWFDPADWFSEDLADPTHPQYCCGVFSDNALIACATLTERIKAEVLSAMDTVILETKEKRDQWQEAVRAHLILLLIMVERYMGDAIKSVAVERPRQWGIVSEVIRRIHEEYWDPKLTLHTVADSLCVSQPHLSRLFRKLTGEGFADYLRNIRLEQACRLLKETELPVEQIIYSCGLRDIPSFYRSFRTYTGKTPGRYREAAGTEHRGGTIMVIMSEISEQVQCGKWKQVKELVQQALDEGALAQQILNEGLLAGMQVIGELFKNNEVYIPEVLMAARAMNTGVQVLKPYLIGDQTEAVGKVCIGTVQGDLHDIGKNLVKMMMEGKGIEVVDLGTDVTPETFIMTAMEQDCKVICCSALLTTTMGVMEEVVQAAEKAGIRDKVKIMIGGAPVTESFCRKIGADVYTSDAASAADAAAELLRK
jgi:corrinoid protein of di/trimethylamine methyltransferase